MTLALSLIAAMLVKDTLFYVKQSVQYLFERDIVTHKNQRYYERMSYESLIYVDVDEHDYYVAKQDHAQNCELQVY